MKRTIKKYYSLLRRIKKRIITKEKYRRLDMTNHLPLSVRVPIEQDNPSIMRDEKKCIKCGMCKNVCTEKIGVHGTYSF